MRLSSVPRPVGLAVAALLATNAVTGLITAWAVRARDFSDLNVNCLLNWGSISTSLGDARDRGKPGSQRDEAAVYRAQEENARFIVHYPRFNQRIGVDRPLVLFCWGVAVDTYHRDNVDVQVDPAVWRAFLEDGPKDVPVYWSIRRRLTHAGAGDGLVRADDPLHGLTGSKPALYRVGPLRIRPHDPLPGEEKPS